MRRRDFITLAGGVAVWPLAARAQQSAKLVVGFLGTSSPTGDAFRVAGVRRGLEDGGYVEGKNVAIEYRHAEDRYDRLPAMAADLVSRGVNVIVTSGGASALAAKAATRTIPIVFSTGYDPVMAGLVASLNRPGGNLTGSTTLEGELEQKRLEMLHELVPAAAVVGFLINPNVPGAVGRTLAVQTRVVQAGSELELNQAFASFSATQIGALVIGTDNFFNSRARQLADLSLRYAVPAMHDVREFTAAGGLVSYGVSLSETYRQVGVYAAPHPQGRETRRSASHSADQV
jgi:putative ABC transport system substrate-binding protein